MILEAVNNCNGLFPCGLTMFYKGVKISRIEFENMNEQDLLEKIAFNTFMYEHTQLGWSIDWCECAFESKHFDDEKTKHIEMAKIALRTLRSYGEAKQSGVEE